jgi:tRNA (guanine-N7-)-methyltransferase
LKREVKSYVHVRSRTSKKDLEIFERYKNNNFFDSKEVSDLSKLLPKKKINILEIGFGDGKNLIEKAKINSDMNFYGIEVFKPGIASVLKQVQIQDLDNICLFYGDAKDFLVKIEKPFFDFIFILFPDPWPKKKHWKRRLIDQNFLNLVKQNLTEKGRLIVKTDWEDYADDIKKEFAKFKVLHDPNVLQSLKPIQTKYEGKAIEEGREVFTYISDLNA